MEGAPSTQGRSGRDRSTRGRASSGEGTWTKPLFVFLTTSQKSAKRVMAYVERTVFKDERIALGTKFFQCMRLNGDALTEGHPLYSLLKGRKLPRCVVVSRDRSMVKRLEGKRIKASTLFSAMKAVARKDYKSSFTSYVVKMRKLLFEIDKLDQQQKALARAKKQAKVKPSLRRKVEAWEKRLKKWADRIEKTEKALNAFVLKPLKKVARAR